jgi:hypothetical protein
MNCAVCSASAESGAAHCHICGHAFDSRTTRRWDRTPEAHAFEDLQSALEDDEALLASTRGRVAGTWRRKISLNPQMMLSPYANLGLTGRRLLLQQVNASTGRSSAGAVSAVPLDEVSGMSVTDADPMEEGRTSRLVVTLNNGETFRVRASGRHAASAKEIVEVWSSMGGNVRVEAGPRCESCGSSHERAYRYCPFCGTKQEDE